MINVSNSTDVDMGLIPFEGGCVTSRRVDELLASPGVQGALDRVGGLSAQSTRGAKECASEGHYDGIVTHSMRREEEERRRDGWR